MLVIVAPSKAKSPPVKLTSPEKDVPWIAVVPVAEVSSDGGDTSAKNRLDVHTFCEALATCVGGDNNQPEVMLEMTPVAQFIDAEGVVSAGVTTAGFVYKVTDANRGASEPVAPS